MRLCFLFNHDQIHQIAHSLPIALALANEGWPGTIIVATTNNRLAHEVHQLGGDAIGTSIQHIELKLKPSSLLIDRLLGGILPAAKLLIYRDNLAFFREIDFLVVAEKTSLLLKTRYGLDGLKIIHTRHGAGDRAIGFNRASAGFDLVLCSGPAIRERLISETGLAPDRASVVGYSKFDIPPPPALTRLSDKPLVLYNPHVSPHLSSWYKHGRLVLDFFVEHDEYDLICAPHVMLFARKFVITIDRIRINRPGSISEKYLKCQNIRFDPGSRASTDMTYTNGADIYLGDASSQVYEFLRKPRPCLFLNSHAIAWQGDRNFAHWQAGPVISSPAELERGLAVAISQHADRYQQVQQELFAERVDRTEHKSSSRAAQAIRSVAFG